MSKTKIPEMCRACLEPAGKMYPLVGKVANVDVNLSTMISFCTSTELELSTDLPDKICVPCFKTIRIAYNFLHQFKESQDKLGEIRNRESGLNETETAQDIIEREVEYVDVKCSVVDMEDVRFDLEVIHNYAGKEPPKQDTRTDLNARVDCRSSKASDNKSNVAACNSLTEKVENSQPDNKNRGKNSKSKASCTSGLQFVSVYPCSMCNMKFRQLGRFFEHVALHNSQQISCDKCPDVPRMPISKYIDHYTKLHRYQCSVCNRSLTSSYGIRYHMKQHENDTKYVCPVKTCTKSFLLQHLLTKHLSTHSSEMRHTCKLCGAKFRTYDTFKYHQRTHGGKRNHLCTQCGKAFFQAVHLRDHMLAHSKAKNFVCDVCGSSFTTVSQLNKHLTYCRKVKVIKVDLQ